MSKKIISLALVIVMLFTFTSISVSAEGETAPELSINKSVTVSVMDTYTLTDSAISPFGVEVNLDTKKIVALDGATTEHEVVINSISARRSKGSTVVYDAENPEPFLDLFRFETPEEKESIGITVDFTINFTSKNVFGDMGYEIVINGFSTPPSLGIDLGDMVAVPTAITYEAAVTEFPTLSNISIVKASTRQFYTDAEYVELEGTQLNVDTVVNTYDANGNIVSSAPHASGTVTYGPLNAHMFTTVPAKDERIPVSTTEIVTYFFGTKLTTLAVTVEHAWSDGPVSITTDNYTTNKPGYHAIVCNGCGEVHSANPHVPELLLDENGNVVLDDNGNPVENWVSNEDATFTANGTSSCKCQDCGATLTRNDLGTAQFNTAFSNYHFLLVIFEYINLLLRIIGAAL